VQTGRKHRLLQYADQHESSIPSGFSELGTDPKTIYTITEDNARAVIGQNLLIIIPVNHMENVVII